MAILSFHHAQQLNSLRGGNSRGYCYVAAADGATGCDGRLPSAYSFSRALMLERSDSRLAFEYQSSFQKTSNSSSGRSLGTRRFRWAVRPLDSSLDLRYLKMEWVSLRGLASMRVYELQAGLGPSPRGCLIRLTRLLAPNTVNSPQSACTPIHTTSWLLIRSTYGRN